ncbi:MAG: hypothetical protein LBL08_02585, partial [Candidatus Nomurabacteria bacterium]|nr:hypothetical protein [Candidatus Nomurabacteria bacterium]
MDSKHKNQIIELNKDSARLKQHETSFLKKHLHALIAVITAIIFVLIVILIDLLMNHVFLTTSASGLEVNMQTNDQGQELPT